MACSNASRSSLRALSMAGAGKTADFQVYPTHFHTRLFCMKGRHKSILSKFAGAKLK